MNFITLNNEEEVYNLDKVVSLTKNVDHAAKSYWIEMHVDYDIEPIFIQYDTVEALNNDWKRVLRETILEEKVKGVLASLLRTDNEDPGEQNNSGVLN